MPIYKNNTLKNALEKLSSCETLRKKFIDMLEKCGPVKPEITLADNFFLMYRIVEKQMHSRQKIEIKRHNLQPKKVSLATRTAIKVKCSGNSSTVIEKNPKTNLKEKEIVQQKKNQLINHLHV